MEGSSTWYPSLSISFEFKTVLLVLVSDDDLLSCKLLCCKWFVVPLKGVGCSHSPPSLSDEVSNVVSGVIDTTLLFLDIADCLFREMMDDSLSGSSHSSVFNPIPLRTIGVDSEL